jgi:hypothetical protein
MWLLKINEKVVSIKIDLREVDCEYGTEVNWFGIMSSGGLVFSI